MPPPRATRTDGKPLPSYPPTPPNKWGPLLPDWLIGAALLLLLVRYKHT